MSQTWLNELRTLFPSSRISLRETERLIYARDLWPLQLIRLRDGALPPLPSVVIWPISEDEVAKAVVLASAHGVPLTPYGGGSGVLGGAMPSPRGIVMDLKRMADLVELHTKNGTCTVQPGILGWNLEDLLNERGYTLGHFPSSLMTATVGGYVVTRSAGQFSSRYGKIEDMLISMRAIDATGRVLDTSRESQIHQGPDANQILLGSEGTLCIVTQATLKVYPLPPHSAYRGVRFDSLEHGLQAMRDIMQHGYRPSVLRLYDPIDTYLVGRKRTDSPAPTPAPAEKSAGHSRSALRDIRHRLRESARGMLQRHPNITRRALKATLAHPAMFEALTQRLLPTEVRLILGFEGELEEVQSSLGAALDICLARGGQDEGEGPGLRWLKKRYDVSFTMPKAYHLGAFVDTIEIAATWDKIPDLYRGVLTAVSAEVMMMAHFSHAYPEGVSIYFSMSGILESLEKSEQRYLEAWRKTLECVAAQGATVSHHHGVGKMKAPWVTLEQGAFLSIYRPIKKAMDPQGILNPGKLYHVPNQD